MPDVDTFVVTGNTPGATAAQDNVLSPPALTYSVELLRRLLGDPMETFETKGASLSRSAPPEEVQPEEYVPRTELGRANTIVWIWAIKPAEGVNHASLRRTDHQADQGNNGHTCN